MSLTIKQKAFCDNYLANNGNATKAAIAAGYSVKVAYQQGAENLKKPAIIEYLDIHSRNGFNPAVVSFNQNNTAFDVLTDYAFGGDKQAALEYLKSL